MRCPILLCVLACCAPCESDLPEVTWEELSGFGYVEGDILPSAILALDGQRVQVTGYLLALDGEEGGLHVNAVVSHIDLDVLDLELGVPPGIDETIIVSSDSDAHDLDRCSVRLEGVLSIGETKIDDILIDLYRMRADRVVELDCQHALTSAEKARLEERLERARDHAR
jgi:hypothetical protein